MSTIIKMRALRSLTATQSPTGKQVNRGAVYSVPDEATAEDHIRHRLAERVPVEAAPAKSGKRAPVASGNTDTAAN